MSPNRAKWTSSFFPWLSAFFLTDGLKSRGEEFQKECPKFLKPRRSTEHDSVMPDDNLLSYSWRSDPKESTTTSSYVNSTQKIASSADKSLCLPSACNRVLIQDAGDKPTGIGRIFHCTPLTAHPKDTSDNKVLPLRPHRDYGSTNRPSVIRPLPVRLQERTCWQALYQASPPASSAQEKRGRGRSICG